jgi:type I restriction enzyme S subunit
MKLDTLFENFDLLMDASNAVPKMRDLILQLAVRGELVEQDHSDEPASELLKRIKAEKEKLITEGKIKKQKPIQPINNDEIPYELPQGWKWSRLGEILTFEYGKGLTKQQRNEKGNIPVYGSNGIVGYHDQYLINRPCIIIGRKGSSGALNICYTDSWTTDVAYYCSPPKELNF